MTDGFFTGTHAALIALFRLLGPGLVRIGANDVNVTHWQASATPMPGGTTSSFVGTADVDALAAFLKATGWKVMYGLNINSEATPANDVAEATYVAKTLGDSLHSFEIGNEPASYAAFKVKWETFHAAIVAAVPTAQFNGPEGNSNINPVQFAADEASRIVLLSHHYYIAMAGSPTATMAGMLGSDNTTIAQTKQLAAAAATNKIRDGFRWGEDNSYWHHGQRGVSDAYGSALWGIEHMLYTALSGGAGVNFHGGGQNMDNNSCPNGPSSCSLPFRYSPIDEVNSQVTAAAPLYYGMLFIARAGVGDLLSTTVAAAGLKVFAAAVSLSDGSTNVVLVDNDASTGLSAQVDMGAPITSASAMYLLAPSLGATSGITFAGSGVSSGGAWTPNAPYALPATGNTVAVVVPPGGAALVHVR